MEGTSLFWVVLVRRAGPSGLRKKTGMFICCESVVCSCTSWARSRGDGGEEGVCVLGLSGCHKCVCVFDLSSNSLGMGSGQDALHTWILEG